MSAAGTTIRMVTCAVGSRAERVLEWNDNWGVVGTETRWKTVVREWWEGEANE